MSSAAVKWAKRQAIEDRTISSVLVVLARHADDNGSTEITQAEIAAEIRVDEKTVRRVLPVIERLGLIARDVRRHGGRRGRKPNLITLSLSAEFSLTKERIMDEKRAGLSGQNVHIKTAVHVDKMSTLPKFENAPRVYKERARGVVSQTLPSESNLTGNVSTRVRFDDVRGKWRASITAGGVTMELGSFISEDEAIEFAEQSRSDVIRTSTGKAGTPSHPVARPHLSGLQGTALADFLFGDSPSQEPDPTERSSLPENPAMTYPEPHGGGAAVALVPRAKPLAGLGGAHETLEQDAARASDRPSFRVVGGRDA